MMDVLLISDDLINLFLRELSADDRSENTLAKYRRDVRGFQRWLDGREVTKDLLTEYKHVLSESGKAASSVNSMLSAINKLLVFSGHPELRVSFLKIQRRVFRDEAKELTRADYDNLVDKAYQNDKIRLGLVLETMGSTGIRISELHYITVESLKRGQADIMLKNKLRVVMFPVKLCEKLAAYCEANRFLSGPVFRTKTGNPLSRQEVWREMKALCHAAGVPESKVYPHNFRHMFATVFYQSCKDIVKLADVLGHSSVNTTRLYLISSGREHAEQLEKLGLVK